MMTNALSVKEKELEELTKEEFGEYIRKRMVFYNNPLHWDNNKRKYYGLPVLRNNINKRRLRKYPRYRPSVSLFGLIEDAITDSIIKKSTEYFNSFATNKQSSDLLENITK